MDIFVDFVKSSFSCSLYLPKTKLPRAKTNATYKLAEIAMAAIEKNSRREHGRVVQKGSHQQWRKRTCRPV